MRKIYLALVAPAAVVIVVFAVLATTNHHTSAGSPNLEGENEPIVHRGAVACGVERWSIKTGTDRDARRVSTKHIVPTTIFHLRSLKAPTFLPYTSRVAPTEATVFSLSATLLRYKIEADSDVHLVISDSGGRTMIAEIPSPDCVGSSSPFLSSIRSARSAFDRRFHPGNFWQRPNVKVQVTGVGFFDFPHGQSGVAPNAIELHPVLQLQVGGSPPPAPIPPTAVPTTVHPVSGAVRASAGVSNASPAHHDVVTVYGHITQGGKGVAGVPMTATWHYKSTTPSCSGVSNGSGTASCSRNIGMASVGYTVDVDVAFSYNGHTYSAVTRFTPQ